MTVEAGLLCDDDVVRGDTIKETSFYSETNKMHQFFKFIL